MPVITVDELTAYMGGIQLTANQEGITDSVIIPGVQQELETYLNRPIEVMRIRESIAPDEDGWITFSVAPMWKVLSVTRSDGSILPGQTLYDPPDLTSIPETDRVWDTAGAGFTGTPYKQFVGLYSGLGLDPVLYGMEPPYFIADYLGGYNGYVNAALKLDLLRVCAREAERMFDDALTLRSGAAENAQNSDVRPKGWQDEELKKWERLRRRVIA